MKKLLKSILAVMSAALLFAGCSNIALNDAKVQDSKSNEKCVLTIGVKDFDKLNIAKANVRSINPYDFEDSTHGETISKFSISGKSQLKNITLDEEDIETSAFTNETTTLTLEKDVWYLTLKAYKNIGTASESSHAVVLMGNARVDLTKTNSVQFVLTTESVTTPGSIALSGTVANTGATIKSYDAGLYDLDKDTLVKTVGASPAFIQTIETYTDTTGTTKDFELSASNVAPGQYMFKIVFKNDEGTAIGFYADEVVVAPGRETAKDDLALSSIIMQKPEAPENLRVYYEQDSDANGYYDVYLTWTDKSYNEENFVVKVLEYDAWEPTAPATTLTPVSTLELGIAEGTGKEIFYKSSMRVAGTLGISATNCKIKLPAGKLYDFEIAAQNPIGKSDFVSRNDTGAAATIAASGTEKAKTLYPAANKVNRVKITYELGGGKLTTLVDSAEVNYTGNYVEYRTYSNTALTLIHPVDTEADYLDTASTKYPKLSILAGSTRASGDALFSRWVNASNTVVSTYNNWQNLIVTADYSTGVSYVISDSYENITATAVYSAEGVTGTSCIYDSENDSTTSIDLAGSVTNPSIKFTATAPTGVTASYDYIKVTLRTLGFERSYGADSDHLDLNISALNSGIYSVVVLAHKVGDNPDILKSDSFTIKIRR